MTWEQKLEALQVLTETALRMRKPGDWYVSAVSRYICGDGLMRASYGQGRSPELAVEDDWRQLVEYLPSDRYIAIDTLWNRRKQYRWNGYMWKEWLT